MGIDDNYSKQTKCLITALLTREQSMVDSVNEEKFYTYIFTRQDLSIEQQMVQTAHATLKLGNIMGQTKERFADLDAEPNSAASIAHRRPFSYTVSPDETYFTLVGVRNLDALAGVIEILNAFDFSYVIFHEPDINNGEATSVAVFPIPESKKGPLRAFNLLKAR